MRHNEVGWGKVGWGDKSRRRNKVGQGRVRQWGNKAQWCHGVMRHSKARRQGDEVWQGMTRQGRVGKGNKVMRCNKTMGQWGAVKQHMARQWGRPGQGKAMRQQSTTMQRGNEAWRGKVTRCYEMGQGREKQWGNEARQGNRATGRGNKVTRCHCFLTYQNINWKIIGLVRNVSMFYFPCCSLISCIFTFFYLWQVKWVARPNHDNSQKNQEKRWR